MNYFLPRTFYPLLEQPSFSLQEKIVKYKDETECFMLYPFNVLQTLLLLPYY